MEALFNKDNGMLIHIWLRNDIYLTGIVRFALIRSVFVKTSIIIYAPVASHHDISLTQIFKSLF